MELRIRIPKRAATAVMQCIVTAWYIAVILCNTSLTMSSAYRGGSPVSPTPPATRDGADNGGSSPERMAPLAAAEDTNPHSDDLEAEELDLKRGAEHGLRQFLFLTPPTLNLRIHSQSHENLVGRGAGVIELRAAGGGTASADQPPRQDQEGEEGEGLERAGGGRPPHRTDSEGSGQKLSGRPEGKQWPAVLPNAGQTEDQITYVGRRKSYGFDGDKGVDIDAGMRSKYYGDVQRERQRWLTNRIAEVSAEEVEDSPAWATVQQARVGLLERGVELWNATYVPPIEPARRQALIDKWSGKAARLDTVDQASERGGGEDAGTGRILFMVTTFDKGESTHEFRGRDRDKFDLILVMMDEMREACEAGFSPQVHLIAAWDISEVEGYLRDRLYCSRLGEYVPLSLEMHPPSIKKSLSIKHRVYMKTRLDDFDLFIQAEDDMITTLNHIVIYQEESELLENRRMSPEGEIIPNSAVPGFIRVEPLGGYDNPFAGSDPSTVEWIEWEIILSRFRPVKIQGAGVYLTLDPSDSLPKGGNCQAMWMATQDQLRRLAKKCTYLRYTETSKHNSPPHANGGLQMFSPGCGFQKVFPADKFESYLIHHAANNKANLRGESRPGVPVSLLRDWAEQFLRDQRELHSEPFYDFDRLDQQAETGPTSSSLTPVAAGKKAALETIQGWNAKNKKKKKSPDKARGGGVEVQRSGDMPREGERKQWPALLPNAGQSEEGDASVDIDSGTRSKYYGDVQRHHQEWLTKRTGELLGEADGKKRAVPWPALELQVAVDEEEEEEEGEGENGDGKEGGAAEGGKSSRGGYLRRRAQASTAELVAERVRRLELGVHLWNTTYVPPIEPQRRQALIDKWSGNAARLGMADREDQGQETWNVQAGRILFMMSTFDRGHSTHRFKGRDKLDFVLMMMDEARESCEVGFSPRVHLIAAWKISEMEIFLRDRTFCRRTGEYVPLSLEEHPPSIKYDLAVKHRVYMKTRLEDFDLFIQAEDDMVVTLNHILIYQEESEMLDNRKTAKGTAITTNTAVPGFIRIESHPLGGDNIALAGLGSSEFEWLEWEIILSRFRPVKIEGAGVYLTLDPSPVLRQGGNCQAIWMATQDQLRKLSLNKRCNYLDYDEFSVGGGSVPFFNGGLQMFGPNCGFQKVFPAKTFESYLIHHASNNKLGNRGESAPGVPISLLRDWTEQFMRDDEFLMTKMFGELRKVTDSTSSSLSY